MTTACEPELIASEITGTELTEKPEVEGHLARTGNALTEVSVDASSLT
jgi:hypothetical protein